MEIDKRKVFRIILALLCATGLFIKTGMYQWDFRPYTLIYFTNLSNIYVLSMMVYTIFCKKGQDQKPVFLRLKGSMMLAIFLTGIVYHFILLPSGFSSGNLSLAQRIGSVLLHYVTPILVFADWIFCDNKGVYEKYDPILWLLVPAYYFLFTVIQAQLGGFLPNSNSRYPYHFIAVDLFGWGFVFVNILSMGIFFLVLGYTLLWADKFIYKRYHRWRRKGMA